jgi:hydrogenase-4 component B
VALAALGASAALAVLCFVKVIGLVLLGEPRRPECATASEPPAGMRGAVVGLAALCVALGPAAGVILPRLVELAPGAVELHPAADVAAPGTGSLPALGLMLALVAAILGLRRLRGTRRAPAAPVWASGQRAAPSLAWTSAGFTKTLRLALEGLLRPRREVEAQARGGVLQAVVHRGAVPHLFDTRLYRPLERTAMRSARGARRLQSGNLRAYLLYLVVLVLGMLALVRAGVLG